MVIEYMHKVLREKSESHEAELTKLGKGCAGESLLSKNVTLLEQTPQLRGIRTIIEDKSSSTEDFVFYFDRLATVLVEQYDIRHQPQGSY